MEKQAQPPTGVQQFSNPSSGRLITLGAWLLAFGVAALAMYLFWRVTLRPTSAAPAIPDSVKQAAQEAPAQGEPASLPLLNPVSDPLPITRRSSIHTNLTDHSDEDMRVYMVNKGDSLFAIASQFKVKPETVLWANYDSLNDNPHQISIGMQLNIPPLDGVYYKWQDGDTIGGVAARFEAKVEDILSWLPNNLDLVDPKVEVGQMIMIPGGHRELRQWIIPTITRGTRSGVSASVYGGGACTGGYDGAVGTGGFIWPAANHFLSGNDYWSGHLAVDIAGLEGSPVYAADSGVVVFAGWATGGYGYMIMIDHGNGYQTLYAHLSAVNVGCGSSVSQGSTIGAIGSTGNSTGAHLHFEVRYNGGFVNPWQVLP